MHAGSGENPSLFFLLIGMAYAFLSSFNELIPYEKSLFLISALKLAAKPFNGPGLGGSTS
jgi:hypothetical protein